MGISKAKDKIKDRAKNEECFRCKWAFIRSIFNCKNLLIIIVFIALVYLKYKLGLDVFKDKLNINYPMYNTFIDVITLILSFVISGILVSKQQKEKRLEIEQRYEKQIKKIEDSNKIRVKEVEAHYDNKILEKAKTATRSIEDMNQSFEGLVSFIFDATQFEDIQTQALNLHLQSIIRQQKTNKESWYDLSPQLKQMKKEEIEHIKPTANKKAMKETQKFVAQA
jgi:hypothetical protein